MVGRNLVLAALVAALPPAAAAQTVARELAPNPQGMITQVGTRGANFLRIGSSARARALGDAGAALTEGAAAVVYNPAAAAFAESFTAEATWTDLYSGSGIRHAFAGIVLPLGSHSFGAHLIQFTSGTIEPTSELSPAGADPILGPAVEWNGTAAGLSYARRLTDRLAVGASAKVVQEGIDFARSTWYALDAGLVFETGLYGVRLAMAINNLGTESRFEGGAVSGSIARDNRIYTDRILGSSLPFRYDTESLLLPTVFRFALQTPVLGGPTALLGPGGPHALHLTAEVNDGFDTGIETRWAVEYAFRGLVFLRAGKYGMNEDRAPWDFTDGASAGAGVRLPLLGSRLLGVDYAYTNMGILGNVQSFTVQVRL